MSAAVDNLIGAQARAMSLRPEVGGFPVLARVLHDAGVHTNEWQLPSGQSMYHTDLGLVVQQGDPLATGTMDVPAFDRDAVVRAIRVDQAGGSFGVFLQAIWAAGVVRYTADLDRRTVTYAAADGATYVESYPDVGLESLRD